MEMNRRPEFDNSETENYVSFHLFNRFQQDICKEVGGLKQIVEDLEAISKEQATAIKNLQKENKTLLLTLAKKEAQIELIQKVLVNEKQEDFNETDGNKFSLFLNEENFLYRDIHRSESNETKLPIAVGDMKFKNSSENERLLYVDGINFLLPLFFWIGDDTLYWHVVHKGLLRKAQRFIACANHTGWKVKVFIDASLTNQLGREAWKHQRNAEVHKEIKKIPEGVTNILADIFRACNTEVVICTQNRTDTIVALSKSDGASILSRDKKLFNCKEANHSVYHDVKISWKGEIEFSLVKRPESAQKNIPCQVLDIPRVHYSKYPVLVDVLTHNAYSRAPPTPLMKFVENPHITVRPLRQALYAKLGVNTVVREEMPCWNTSLEELEWVTEDVCADSSLGELLDAPMEALTSLFPNTEDLQILAHTVPERKFSNHIFSLCVLCFELCAIASDQDLLSLIQTHQDAVKSFYGIQNPKRKNLIEENDEKGRFDEGEMKNKQNVEGVGFELLQGLQSEARERFDQEENSLIHDANGNQQFQKKVAGTKEQAGNVGKERLLYVDAVGYLLYAFFWLGNDASHWTVAYGNALKKAQRFVKCANHAGWTLKIFVDASVTKRANKEKWIQRRDAEVRKGAKKIPEGALTIMADAFRACDTEVVLCSLDFIDTIAMMAEKDGAAILSSDKEFAKFCKAKFTVYSGVKVNWKGQRGFSLVPRPKSKSKENSSRQLLTELPSKILCENPMMVDVVAHNEYFRVSPTPLLKLVENPHITVRPLREALYARMGVEGVVIEQMPIWNRASEEVEWVVEDVKANDSFDELLDLPMKALTTFFPNTGDLQTLAVSVPKRKFENHIYGICVTCFELCAVATGKDLLCLIQAHQKDVKSFYGIENKKVVKRKQVDDSEISDESKVENMLYIDGISFISLFCEIESGTVSWQTAYKVLLRKVKRFVKCADHSGWKLKVFIAGSLANSTEKEIWKNQRNAEIHDEEIPIPDGIMNLLADSFRACNTEVLICSQDCTDTIASFAQKDGASILSHGTEFFRYEGMSCNVYCNAEINWKGDMEFSLVPSIWNTQEKSSRTLVADLATQNQKYTVMVDVILHRQYSRGSPTPLLKFVENPHITVRPLRKALYSRLGIQGIVKEEMPCWNGEFEEVEWVIEDVEADDCHDGLLDHPMEALITLFPNTDSLYNLALKVPERKFKDHIFSLCTVTFELCAIATGLNLHFLLKTHQQEIRSFYGIGRLNLSKQLILLGPCSSCNQSFSMHQKEIDWFRNKGIAVPKRCKSCRDASKI